MNGEDPPLVSILIPARNAGRWIRRCVESALAQDWSRVEVWVCEDGSTDETAAILAEFGERIRVIEGGGKGSNPARNRLLERASGEWIQHLDADDEMKPDKISRQFAEAGNSAEVDVLYSPTIDEVWNDGQRVSAVTSHVGLSLDPVSQWFLWELSQANGSLWRKASLVRIGGWNEAQACCQDNELYARALRSGLRFKFCPTAGAIYRIWSRESLSRRDPLESLRVRWKLMEEMCAWLEGKALWTAVRRRSAGQAFLELCRQWALHDPDAAAGLFARKKEEGLIALAGPAAPFLYAWTCRMFGFRAAEQIAAFNRKW
ncbi:MAG: glycosyltransferase [Verrucomicrobiia bacterium]